MFLKAFRSGLLLSGLAASCLCAQDAPGSPVAPLAPPAIADTSGELLEVPPPPPPFPALDPEEVTSRRARALKTSGNILYHAGTLSLIGGIAGGIVAANRDAPGLGQAAGIAYLAGLPLIGIGSSQVHHAYRIEYPDEGGDGRIPWVLFGGGWAAQLLGLTLFASGIVESVADGFTGREDDGGGASMMIAGTFIGMGGIGMHLVSWYQFSERRAEANEALSFSLEPMIPLDPRGGVAGAGLRLKASF